MTSPAKQLTNGDEDPYKSEGHVELKIANLSGFVQEELYSQRLSDSVYVRGVPWKIEANLRERKYLGFFLQCNAGTDPFWSYSADVKLKILAQKEGSIDHCRKSSINTFNAKIRRRGYRQYMKIEDLMNPDKGWYNEQSDSIILAADFTAELPAEALGKYVLVAQNELKLDKDPFRFSMQIDHMEWEINTKDADPSLVLLSCKDVTRGRMDKVLLELFCYHRDDSRHETYSPIPRKSAYLHLFTAKDNSLTVVIPVGSVFNNILFTARVWKERSQFLNFTKPTTIVGRYAADMKLRVGDQQFHVNKQLLSSHSDFFDRMFNGLYPAATQQEVELDVDMHSAELFHDFLLVMCVNETLPNSVTVASLFKLADYYNVGNVRQKCIQYIRMAREMCIEKRVLLACDHGSKETLFEIMDSANLEQAKRINRLLVEHYCPKH